MFAKFERKAVLNVLGGFLAGYGFTAFVCFFVLIQVWESAAPHFPDPARGLIYRHNEHGWVTYFSAFQATSCWLLFLTSIPIALVGGHIRPKRNWNVVASRFGIRSTYEADDPRRVGRWGFLAGVCFAPVVIVVAAPPLVRWLNGIGFVANF
nr:hypothetical protein P9270_021235 [Mesorhizobium sp. WSM4875]